MIHEPLLIPGQAMIRTRPGVEPVSLKSGDTISCNVTIQARGIAAPDRVPDVAPEHQTRDLLVERAGDKQKITESSGGKVVFTGSGPAGKKYSVRLQRLPDNQ